jgi:hypothetical protein
MLTTLITNALGIRLTNTTAHGRADGEETLRSRRFSNGRSGHA